jgi:hypothetical protein
VLGRTLLELILDLTGLALLVAGTAELAGAADDATTSDEVGLGLD